MKTTKNIGLSRSGIILDLKTFLPAAVLTLRVVVQVIVI